MTFNVYLKEKFILYAWTSVVAALRLFWGCTKWSSRRCFQTLGPLHTHKAKVPARLLHPLGAFRTHRVHGTVRCHEPGQLGQEDERFEAEDFSVGKDWLMVVVEGLWW